VSKVRTLLSYMKFGFEAGSDVRSRWLLATMLPRLKLVQALGLSCERIWQVSLQVNRSIVRDFHFRTQDIFIVYEILSGNPYCPDWLRHKPIARIVDLGAHIGLATLQFKAHFPNAVVHCYEPDPDNFRLLKLNMQSFNGVVLHQEAVGVASGEGVFYTNPQRRSASSLVKPKDTRGVVEVRCQVRSLDDILSDIGGVDLVKFDIEGMEYEVFSHSRLVHEVHYLVGEMKASEEGLKRFLALFPQHEAQVKNVTPKLKLIYLIGSQAGRRVCQKSPL